MKFIAKIIIGAMVLVSFYSFILNTEAQAVCPFPGCFDGVAVGQIYCTCSNNFLVFFSPLYLYPSAGPIAGSLVFQPGTMMYLNYNIIPSEGVVGTYMPGVPACWMVAPHGCYPMPSLGLILPVTGSSLPGGGFR
jgi:hypothetical protein